MDIEDFVQQLDKTPTEITFEQTMAVIDDHYDFTPVAFRNGKLDNLAGSNNGSCKIFAFAHLNQLSVQQTLTCFGQFYREDVLGDPQGNDHQNIRNFIHFGWDGVKFTTLPLKVR